MNLVVMPSLHHTRIARRVVNLAETSMVNRIIGANDFRDDASVVDVEADILNHDAIDENFVRVHRIAPQAL
jgi:hypothetical protein